MQPLICFIPPAWEEKLYQVLEEGCRLFFGGLSERMRVGQIEAYCFLSMMTRHPSHAKRKKKEKK
jgi:hypothetical protein